jgi:NAD(P)-dependent dehydrogenase (short-subunit alcohol dehydrogenase family)
VLALVTGATTGLGVHIADGLASLGYEVLRPGLAELDLSSLDSVRAYADGLAAAARPVSVVVLNAGVYAPPSRVVTDDGFELQWQVNLLGHFALVARLFPVLRAGGARIVVQSSESAKRVRFDDATFADLQMAGDYRPVAQYARTKLGLGLFALELGRRSRAAGWGLNGAIAHPGVAATQVFAASGYSVRQARMVRAMARFGIFNTPEKGAAAALSAATTPDAGGRFFGPRGPGGFGGRAAERPLWRTFQDTAGAARLWAVLQDQAGVALGE